MERETELQVNMLGEFSLTYGGKVIVNQNSRSGKAWALLEYLIAFRGKEVSQNELIDLLWPEEDEISDPGNTLKTLLHRARALLAQLDKDALYKAISYRRGAYRWEPAVPCRIDAELFDDLCKRSANERDDEVRLEMLCQAINLYKGDFLPREALEAWVMPINTYYRAQYIKIVYQALDMLMERGRTGEVMSICQKAVAIEPYEEGLHLAMIKALLDTGDQRRALQHYKHVTDLFFSQFGISPSDELTALYKEVVKTDKSMELDLGIIKEGLQEVAPERGAFYCEYEFFKDIYHLEARAAMRTGEVIYIALITATSDNRKPLTQKQINMTMERLKDVVANSLRRNDVFTRYSVTQYLLMLPCASFENGQMIMNRITRTFRNQYPKMAVILQHRLLPLDPLTD